MRNSKNAKRPSSTHQDLWLFDPISEHTRPASEEPDRAPGVQREQTGSGPTRFQAPEHRNPAPAPKGNRGSKVSAGGGGRPALTNDTDKPTSASPAAPDLDALPAPKSQGAAAAPLLAVLPDSRILSPPCSPSEQVAAHTQCMLTPSVWHELLPLLRQFRRCADVGAKARADAGDADDVA